MSPVPVRPLPSGYGLYYRCTEVAENDGSSTFSSSFLLVAAKYGGFAQASEKAFKSRSPVHRLVAKLEQSGAGIKFLYAGWDLPQFYWRVSVDTVSVIS
ncbi:LysR family transcriptional regulator [Alkalimonas collagenimarina]|uniref:LysR family transcriptional regulator n=1 Tax=Alkalimonas collagenimarina TaxID=400390 RepID=A0ABT9GUN3_9GAMM|nr:LysR family transcriptional regulator [Alkalimonas collagenimarina]MDP4534766.1 LysR family transcriptional regulator [Alkalimonas collagenimarina]